MKKLLVCLFLFTMNIVWAQTERNERNSNSLLLSSSISITIGGAFVVNGSFPALPTERLDQFITRTYSEVKTELAKDPALANESALMKDKKLNFALRDIKLKRATGEEFSIDLKKFRLNGDFKNNPYLKNDDVIIFPPLDMDRNFVSIFGAVNKPVKFQFVEGDKFSDAIEFAQGVSNAYEKIEGYEITRLSYDGNSEQVLKYTIDQNMSLQQGDRIRVVADETSKKDFKVLVLGEVNRPGTVSITKNNTTLKEVINKAGGFKPTADLRIAELIRGSSIYSEFSKQIQALASEREEEAMNILWRTLIQPEEEDDLLMQRMSYLAEEDTIYFKVDDKMRLYRGNASINFTDLTDPQSEASNYLVKDGDLIIIPEKNDMIYVFGQIPMTGFIKYQEGKDYQFYINQAGGYGQEAKDEVFVIKGRTRNWLSTDENKNIKIEPGDYIWVPKKAPKTFKYYLDRISAVMGVVGSIATVILLVVSLK